MTTPNPSRDEVKSFVRERYAGIAKGTEQSCGNGGTSCCGGHNTESCATDPEKLGYSVEDLELLPKGANLGLGCGNPQAIAALKAGETVLDLGSGAGIDCFLAARQVGPSGHVIGVDMTHEMLAKARENARKGGFENVDFRLGEIENLPVADASVDVILSNCVINLSPDKPQVYREGFRVLKPGGRIAVADIVATAEMPEAIRKDMTLYTGCVAGASYIGDLERMLKDAGFEEIRIAPKDTSKRFIKEWAEGHKIEDYVVSATIEAKKPGGR
jgi:arsenite methyltransferase